VVKQCSSCGIAVCWQWLLARSTRESHDHGSTQFACSGQTALVPFVQSPRDNQGPGLILVGNATVVVQLCHLGTVTCATHPPPPKNKVPAIAAACRQSPCLPCRVTAVKPPPLSVVNQAPPARVLLYTCMPLHHMYAPMFLAKCFLTCSSAACVCGAERTWYALHAQATIMITQTPHRGTPPYWTQWLHRPSLIASGTYFASLLKGFQCPTTQT
jgi:hypothetical protein